MSAAPEPKRGKMLGLLSDYGITVLDVTSESDTLAALYIKEEIIPARFFLDGAHIAMASIHGLDVIISYNFKHINRVKTKLLTGKLNRAQGYGSAVICTAKEVLEDGHQQE